MAFSTFGGRMERRTNEHGQESAGSGFKENPSCSYSLNPTLVINAGSQWTWHHLSAWLSWIVRTEKENFCAWKCCKSHLCFSQPNPPVTLISISSSTQSFVLENPLFLESQLSQACYEMLWLGASHWYWCGAFRVRLRSAGVSVAPRRCCRPPAFSALCWLSCVYMCTVCSKPCHHTVNSHHMHTRKQ